MKSLSIDFLASIRKFPQLKLVFYFDSLLWNQKTPLGYFGYACFSLLTSNAFLFITGPILVLFISMYLHHEAFFKMFSHSLRQLNTPDKNVNDQNEIRKLLQFHNSLKGWFLVSSDVYSNFVIIILINTMLGPAFCIFLIDMVIFYSKNMSFVYKW